MAIGVLRLLVRERHRFNGTRRQACATGSSAESTTVRSRDPQCRPWRRSDRRTSVGTAESHATKSATQHRHARDSPTERTFHVVHAFLECHLAESNSTSNCYSPKRRNSLGPETWIKSYEYLSFLHKNYADLSGLDEATALYLRQDAQNSFAKQNYEETLDHSALVVRSQSAATRAQEFCGASYRSAHLPALGKSGFRRSTKRLRSAGQPVRQVESEQRQHLAIQIRTGSRSSASLSSRCNDARAVRQGSSSFAPRYCDSAQRRGRSEDAYRNRTPGSADRRRGRSAFHRRARRVRLDEKRALRSSPSRSLSVSPALVPKAGTTFVPGPTYRATTPAPNSILNSIRRP